MTRTRLIPAGKTPRSALLRSFSLTAERELTAGPLQDEATKTAARFSNESMRVRPTAPVVVALLVLSVACSTADRSTGESTAAHQERSRLCDIYRSDESEITPATIEDTVAQVEDIARRVTQRDNALADAATPSEREIISAGNDANRRYQARLLREWRLDGAGPGLHDRAVAAGYLGFREYVETLAFDDPAGARLAQRASSALLASKCDKLVALTDKPLTDDLPGGEIIATSAGSHTIRRFSPGGDDLGAIDVPRLGGEITFDSLSPDGRYLAVLTNDNGQRLTIVDLRDGTSTEASVAGCVDWADNSTIVVWTRQPTGNRLIRLGLDGNPVAGTTDVAFDGCAYRYTSDRLLTVRPRIDGAPISIQSVPATGGEPTTVVETKCNLVSPRVSPDGTALSYAAGCSRTSESGVYVANSDGSGQRQLVAGTTTGSAWSPDGRWLTFSATDTEHAGDPSYLRTYVASADGKRVGVVTPPGFTWAVWRPATV